MAYIVHQIKCFIFRCGRKTMTVRRGDGMGQGDSLISVALTHGVECG